MELIDAKKRAVVEASEKGGGDGRRNVKADDVQGKDLLSLLIKANMASDLPEEKRMTENDVLFRKSWCCLCAEVDDCLN